MDNPPESCLRLFDEMDLDELRQRRLATYALEDYYGTILSTIGRDSLDFSPDDTELGIGTQWEKAQSRLRQVGIDDVPEEYVDRIHRLSSIRNSIAHQYQHNPRTDYLLDAREIAIEWFEWITEQSRIYQKRKDSQTVGEALDNMVVAALDAAYVDPGRYDYGDLKNEQEEINNQIEYKVKWRPGLRVDKEDFSVSPLSELSDPDSSGFGTQFGNDSTNRNNSEISRRDLLKHAEALELKHKAESISKENTSRNEETGTPSIPDSRFFEVIQPFEEDEDVVFLSNMNQKQEFWQDLNELDDVLRRKLRELEEVDVIEAVVGVDRRGELYVKDVLRVNP